MVFSCLQVYICTNFPQLDGDLAFDAVCDFPIFSIFSHRFVCGGMGWSLPGWCNGGHIVFHEVVALELSIALVLYFCTGGT